MDYSGHLEFLYSSSKNCSSKMEDEDLFLNNIISGQDVYEQNRSELKDIFYANYVNEMWITESPPTGVEITLEIVDGLIECGEKPSCCDQYQWTKITNICKALLLAMESDITLNLINIREVHRIVCEGIVENGGKYRTKNMFARGSAVVYAKPNSIDSRLKALLDFIDKKLTKIMAEEDPKFRLKLAIKLGAVFYSEFLLIHPFSNGNGRTARLLLNLLLKSFVVAPFSLYFSPGREEYLNDLENRNDGSPPSALAEYIVLSCNRTVANVKWLQYNC